MELYSVTLTVESDTLCQSVVPGKGNAIQTARRWIKETEGVRKVCVLDIGKELKIVNHGVTEELDLLGNERAIFTLERN